MKVKILVFLLSVILGFLCYLYFVSPPVLFRYVERPAEEKYRASVIFNPFRDRAPESRSEIMLKDMQMGNFEKAFTETILNQKSIDYYLKAEKRATFLDWNLMDRKDEGNEVKLYYLVHRKYVEVHHNYENDIYEQHIIITVMKCDSVWCVVDYNAIY